MIQNKKPRRQPGQGEKITRAGVCSFRNYSNGKPQSPQDDFYARLWARAMVKLSRKYLSREQREDAHHKAQYARREILRRKQ